MIKRTFVFEIGRDHDLYFQLAQSAASAAGASFSGNRLQGSFNHRGVYGVYQVDGGLVTVELDKPLGVPWGPMERAMKRFFGHPPAPRQPLP